MAEQVVANPVELEQAAPPAAEPKGESLAVRAIDGTWRLLRRPWLLVALLILLGATLLWARMVPQVPGQLTESAAETTRWLNSTLASASIPGAELARTLGLFDLYASPWLRLLLALSTLLATVQLADRLGRLRSWRNASYEASIGAVGEPVALSMTGLARTRLALAIEPESAEVRALEWATSAGMNASSFARVAQIAEDGDAQALPVASDERRLLLRKRGWSAGLALLLPVGALIGALILWANLFWAWNLRPDMLAPGASFTSESRGVSLRNEFDPERLPGYALSVNGQETLFAADGEWFTLRGFGAPRVRADDNSLALMVQADAPILALPNAPSPQEKVGVLLPSLGSEQFVLLPTLGIGLRLVSITDGIEDQIWAEVYDEESVQPIVRQRIESEAPLDIPLGEAEPLQLVVAPVRGLQIEIERSFGRLLWLPALIMILAGLVALFLPARMLLIQLSPWEKERTLLVAQGTSARDVAAVVSATQP